MPVLLDSVYRPFLLLFSFALLCVGAPFVSFFDTYPTPAELKELQAPRWQLDGESLVPLPKNPDGAVEARSRTAYLKHMILRFDRYRHIRYKDGEEEFFDWGNDPHEWTNQIGNPEFFSAIARIRSQVPSMEDMRPEVGKKGDS